MQIGQLRQYGVGSVILTIYVSATLYQFGVIPKYKMTIFVSFLPFAAIWLFLDSYNDQLVVFLAGRSLTGEVAESINQSVEDEFYYADNEPESDIDELDMKVSQKVSNILCGVCISITLPIFVYLQSSILYSFTSLLPSVLIYWIMIRKQRNKLQNVINQYPRLY